MSVDTLPKLLRDYASGHPDVAVQYSKDASGEYQAVTWGEFYRIMEKFAAGLTSLGATRGDHVGIISDNRKEWLVADLAMLCIGVADVPRGSDSTAEEIKYILGHAECGMSFVENATQLDKILTVKKDLRDLKTMIVLDQTYEKTDKKRDGVRIYTYGDVLEAGKTYLQDHPDHLEAEIEKSRPEDLATLIYTSGTTGVPKGVMLTHSNYMHQVRAPHTPLDIRENDIFFSILPVWHSYERAIEYVAIFCGCSIAYSKAVTIIEDMGKVKPQIFPSVPRIWEGVKRAVYKKMSDEGGIKYALFRFFVAVGTAHSKLKTMLRGLKPQFKKRSVFLDALVSFLPFLLLTPLNALGQLLVFSKIKARLGGRFRFGASGAGALPPHVDEFFAAAGVQLLEGYGLTETSPIVSVRDCRRPVPNTIGPPLPDVEVKVVDEKGNTLPPGQKGVLHVRGPSVMKGYYKMPEETAKTISPDGWLDTGDLAMLTHRNQIAILGRIKETVVLLGGENVEPGPIEDTIAESDYIDQVMIVGQDQRFLGALVVPAMEAVEEFAKENGVSYSSPEDLLTNEDINHVISDEINALVCPKRGFKLFERVNQVKLIGKAFEPGVEMTHSLKLKRNVIAEIYAKEIAALFE